MSSQANISFRLRDIIPSEDIDAMGRRRYQRPSVFKTEGKRPMWYFRARVDTITAQDGQRALARPEERYYIGYVDEIGKREAEKRRDEILGEAINRPQVLIPSQVKFEQVLKIYRREHLSMLRETTRETQESIIKRHIELGLGPLRMCDLDQMTIQRWLSSMALAYKTKQGVLALLRVIWGKAEEWGFTQARFPRGKFVLGVNRSVKGREMPTMEQIRKLLAVLEDPYRGMAEVALYAGLRISEVRGLQWTDVTADSFIVRRRVSIRGKVDVPKSQLGTRAFDVRPLSQTFARQPRKGDYVFADAGSYSKCNDVMMDAREKAGITVARFGWHHLRGIFNTLMRGAGADSLDRQALMGHSSERMNEVYVMQQDTDTKRRGDLMLQVQGLVVGETKGGLTQ